MASLSRKDWILLALLTLCWGINWPVMKIGVLDFPPLAFRTLCMAGSLPAIWLVARFQRVSLAIPPGQLKSVIKVTLPNMLVWHFFIIYGVKLLSSGRVAILGYTMPVWAVLFGLLFYGERISHVAWLGVGCALAGALLLLSAEVGTMAGQPLGSVLALIAAAGWGYGTVLLKRTQIDMPTLALTFWMIALAAIAMLAATVLFEIHLWRRPTPAETAAIIYNALIVFGFAHVVWFKLARTLPPVASSLSVMLIPVVGVFSGALLLGETPHWQDYAAMGLILIAMSSVLLKPKASDTI
ncbi:DMT family transporter [Oxalobacteraceae bacterium R-40]|uniref:DMT family transporter n=1 Tax=Keguizhuia sedimenti TaxID=3064264 RepID=A0ABU1BLT8_9BURK|nr:DMT family transporter [Oxalobacteraceae bacterium R-40]